AAAPPPCPTPPPPRLGGGDPLHPPPASSPCLAGHSLQPDRGHGHPRRAEGPGGPSAPLRPDHRARLATQRLDRAPGPPRPAPAPSGVPRSASPGLQPPPSGGPGGTGLPQGSPPPLLHLGGQGRLRRRRLLAVGLLPPQGRGPLVPRGVLEGPRHPRTGPVGQRPRVVRLGAGGAVPVACDPVLFAVRRRAGLHPGQGATVQRRGGELQWLVPAAAVRPALPPAGRPAAGAGAAAGGGGNAARPPPAPGGGPG